jgi:hypothetical protein
MTEPEQTLTPATLRLSRDTHAVLTPALDGFAPTSQMPEIAEAQALLKTLP